MASPRIRSKRSSVEGKVPAASQLMRGEFAVNSYDGKVYILKDQTSVGIATTTVTVNPWDEPNGVGAGVSYSSDVNVLGVVTATSFVGDGSGLTNISVAGISTFSGNYNHLFNKPTIPTNNNQLTNGAGYITGYTVTSSDVTAHEGDITITESQISDLGTYLTSSDLSSYATTSYVDTEVAGLVDSAPGTLDTLNELAAALGDDANFSTTVTNSIATKMPLAGGTFTGTVTFASGQTFNYNSLTNKPTIPTNNNQLTNGAGYITSADGGNAATLDSLDSTQFLRSDADDTSTGRLTLQRGFTSDTDYHLYIRQTTNGEGATIKFADDTNATQFGYFTYKHQDVSSNSASNSFHFDSSESSTAVIIDQTSGNSGFYVGTNEVWHAGNDGSGSGLDADTVDGVQASNIHRTVATASATVGPGWITVATNTSGRKHGEIIVSDSESGDHGFIRIDWMRSFADSNFTVLNCGGHSNRITGARVLYQNSDNTYGEKILQVYVTVSSNYRVQINQVQNQDGWAAHTVHTPVVESPSGYSVHGNTLSSLQTYGLAHEEGIQAGGSILAGGDITSSSDISLKENVVTYENALDKVLAMRGVEYDRKDQNGKHEVGLIAQEVENIIPEVVAQNNGIKSIAYGKLTAVLIEAIKEQQEQIKHLQQQLNIGK